jgi:alpha-1,6-mannosyltransferase
MNRRHVSRVWWVAIAIETWFVAWMSRHGDFFHLGEPWKFAALGIAAGAAYWVAVRGFLHAPMTAAHKACLFWGTAVVLRLAILPVTPGDDIWRYRWEGEIQLHGFNPYQLAPDSAALAGLRDGDWSKINHRDFPAIYPPLAELVFAALAACRVPVLGYKLFFGTVDLAAVAVLRRLLVRRGSPADAAAWYAWNPLAVYVSAGAAHFDCLMVLALLGAILLLDSCLASTRGTNANSSRFSPAAGGSALLLGTAVAIKIVPAVLLPVWVLALGWRRALLTLPIGVAALLVPAFYYGFPRVPVFTGLRGFALNFRVNDAFWWLVDAVRQTNPAAQVNGMEALVALLICGGLAVWFHHDWPRGVLWVMGAALLLSPEFHAWYLVWVLPLAAWRGRAARPWFVLSISLFGYFLLWDLNHWHGIPWLEPLWLRLFIYFPPVVALGWWHLTRARRCEPGGSMVRKLPSR